ncbi:hypothetical protein MTR67_022710 [Solanum verrucosum]|uniref:DUF4218 domain-containing protein n=1 Tax=Solanum verrucosum TaxID=315347 RepID=A0AAF0QYC7_SOLVR|nr:hypothetical protein MTR67_022710 [Solanum verrucosum]
MGHRRYLPKDHRWRNDKKSFDDTIEKRLPLKTCFGIDILNQVRDIEGHPLTKEPKKKRKISHEKRKDNWNKKSIFLELPFWKSLLLRHNLDVMHIEKNICDNIMGTIMNVKGKTKDIINTRLDLKKMNIRPELHPIQRGEKVEVPDGFSSNIYQCVNLKDHKISGLKVMIVMFFCIIYSLLIFVELRIDDLKHIEEQIPIILCKLEKVFPPCYFDVMVHLPIHLASEAEIAGPIHYRWMYPIERWLYFLKSLIGNRACPEGCIAEGYIAIECMTLCSREFTQNHIDTTQHLSDAEWDQEFIEWFKDRVAQLHKTDNGRLMKDLLSLSRGPTKYSTHSNGYIVNGYRFHVEDHDQMLKIQNCGVVVVGENDKDSKNVDYYGILTDVIELQFISDRRLILFRCIWFDVFNMKTENEDGSIMKSTIRYSYVAPGAMEEDEDEGLSR